MAIIIRSVTNNTPYLLTLKVPSLEANLSPVSVAPSATLDLLSVVTEDDLIAMQLYLEGMVSRGSLTVAATFDTATLEEGYNGGGGGGANTTLSNLTSPTALNQDILPASDGSRSLGSSSVQFGQLYTYNVISNNDDLDLTSAFNVYLASGPSSDIILNAGSGHINVDTHNITNMADPVNPQDAATKNYVDTHSAAPAGNPNDIQFNNGGAFGANDVFFWDNNTETLNVPKTGIVISPLGGGNSDGSIGVDNGHNLQIAASNTNSASLILFGFTPNMFLNPTGASGVNDTSSSNTADPSAAWDIQSTTKGLLLPRLTTVQRDAIVSPATGLEIYNTDTNQDEYYNGTTWNAIGNTAVAGANTQLQFNASGSFGADSNLVWDNTNKVLTVTTGDSQFYAISASPAIKILGHALSPSAELDFYKSDNSFALGSIFTDETTNNFAIAGGNSAGDIVISPFSAKGVLINSNSSAHPDASAMFEIDSTTQGFLSPRMTTVQKDAIASPAEGLTVYDITLHKLSVWTGAAWETVTSA